MTTVNRSDVLRRFSQAHLDINQLLPEVAAALEGEGETREQLQKIAGEDGHIAGRAEARALYDAVNEIRRLVRENRP